MQDQPTPSFFAPIEFPPDFCMTSPGPFTLLDRPISHLDYHDVLELGVCHRGSGILVVAHKILRFSAGDVYLINPGEPHLAQSDRGTTSELTFLFVDTNRLPAPF